MMTSKLNQQKNLNEAFRKLRSRYQRIKERSKQYKIRIPPFHVFKEWFLDKYRNGFRCEYCGRPLLVDAPKIWIEIGKFRKQDWHPSIFSIDHKVPLEYGGTNDLDNLALVCLCCNMLKGTMLADFYVEHFIKPLKAYFGNRFWEVMDEMYKQLRVARLRYKIDRLEAEGTIKKKKLK